jgi:hypothetical protein
MCQGPRPCNSRCLFAHSLLELLFTPVSNTWKTQDCHRSSVHDALSCKFLHPDEWFLTHKEVGFMGNAFGILLKFHYCASGVDVRNAIQNDLPPALMQIALHLSQPVRSIPPPYQHAPRYQDRQPVLKHIPESKPESLKQHSSKPDSCKTDSSKSVEDSKKHKTTGRKKSRSPKPRKSSRSHSRRKQSRSRSYSRRKQSRSLSKQSRSVSRRKQSRSVSRRKQSRSPSRSSSRSPSKANSETEES